MDNLDLFDLGFLIWILIVVIAWIILRIKCPRFFRKAKAPDKCSKCEKSDFLPVYSKMQKQCRIWFRFTAGGPIAFKCNNCGNEVKVKKGEGFFASGDLTEPHA